MKGIQGGLTKGGFRKLITFEDVSNTAMFSVILHITTVLLN